MTGCLIHPKYIVEQIRQGISHNGTGDHTDQPRNHERVVEQIFADNGRSGAVEVHRCDIRGIVGDEEVSIDTGHNTEQNHSIDAHFVGQGEHGNHDGTLRVNQNGDKEEDKGDGPGVLGDDVAHHFLDLGCIVPEISVGHPGDTEDGNDGHHA